MNIDGTWIPLLASPTRHMDLLSIVANSVNVADNAARARILTRCFRPGRRYAKQACDKRHEQPRPLQLGRNTEHRKPTCLTSLDSSVSGIFSESADRLLVGCKAGRMGLRQKPPNIVTHDNGFSLVINTEVEAKEVHIMGPKSVLLRTLVAAPRATTAVLACSVLHR